MEFFNLLDCKIENSSDDELHDKVQGVCDQIERDFSLTGILWVLPPCSLNYDQLILAGNLPRVLEMIETTNGYTQT